MPLFTSFVLASISLPSFTRSFVNFKESVLNGLTPNESFYFTRIYSIQTPKFSAQNSYINLPNLDGLSNDSLSFPEILQRIVFLELSQGIYENYIWFSLIFLTLLIFTVVTLVYWNSRLGTVQILSLHLMASLTLYLIVGNERVADTEYGFYRIINPQFSLVLWLGGVLLIKWLFKNLLEERSIRRQIFLGAICTFIAQFSYIFVFLSLIVAYFLIGAYLFVKGRRRAALEILVIWSLLISQWSFVYLNNSRSVGFREASERMGLLESHLPGAFYTALLCVASMLISFLGAAIAYLKTGQLVFSPLTFSICISSTALIIASNSNIFSGKSIQFSDHFEIFAYMNLALAILNAIWGILKERKLPLVIVATCIFFFHVSQVESFGAIYATKESRSFDVDVAKLVGVIREENLVVESPNTADLISVYAPTRVLFDTRMVSYGFSNRELLLRLYVSRGCPNRLTAEEIQYVYTYSVAPYLQKSERMTQVLNRLGLNEVSQLIVSPLNTVAKERERVIMEDVKNLYLNYGKFSCIALASTFGAKGVVFDGSGNWARVLESNGLRPRDLNWANLRYFDFQSK